MAMDIVQREQDVRRGIRLEYLTVGWNILEGAIAILSGTIAGSVALVGFGIDSAIESSSGAVLLWRLHAERNGENVESLEARALKLVGIGFFLLAAYVAFESISTSLKGSVATERRWHRACPGLANRHATLGQSEEAGCLGPKQ